MFCEHTVNAVSVIHIHISVPGRMLSKPERYGMTWCECCRHLTWSSASLQNRHSPQRRSRGRGRDGRRDVQKGRTT